MKVKIDRNVIYGKKLYHSGEAIEIPESEQEAWKHFGTIVEPHKVTDESVAEVKLAGEKNTPKKATRKKTAAKKN